MKVNGDFAVRYLSKTFWGGLFVGMFLFGIFTSVGIWITVHVPVALYPAPIIYVDPTIVGAAALCPGDNLRTHTTIQFGEGGAVVETYVTLRDVASGRNVPGSLEQMPVRVQPRAIRFDDAYSYTIPANLPPGQYEYIRATVAVNVDAEPAFMTLPFEVKPCP